MARDWITISFEVEAEDSDDIPSPDELAQFFKKNVDYDLNPRYRITEVFGD